MRESINVELIGIIGVLLLYNVWDISFRQYIIGLVFVVAMVGVYVIYYVYNKNLKASSTLLKYKSITREKLKSKNLIEARRIGIFIILIGLVGIIGITILSNRVFIGVQVIGNAIGITVSIIMNTLIIEEVVVVPILLTLKRRSTKRYIKSNIGEHNKYPQLK